MSKSWEYEIEYEYEEVEEDEDDKSSRTVQSDLSRLLEGIDDDDDDDDDDNDNRYGSSQQLDIPPARKGKNKSSRRSRSSASAEREDLLALLGGSPPNTSSTKGSVSESVESTLEDLLRRMPTDDPSASALSSSQASASPHPYPPPRHEESDLFASLLNGLESSDIVSSPHAQSPSNNNNNNTTVNHSLNDTAALQDDIMKLLAGAGGGEASSTSDSTSTSFRNASQLGGGGGTDSTAEIMKLISAMDASSNAGGLVVPQQQQGGGGGGRRKRSSAPPKSGGGLIMPAIFSQSNMGPSAGEEPPPPKPQQPRAQPQPSHPAPHPNQSSATIMSMPRMSSSGQLREPQPTGVRQHPPVAHNPNPVPAGAFIPHPMTQAKLTAKARRDLGSLNMLLGQLDLDALERGNFDPSSDDDLSSSSDAVLVVNTNNPTGGRRGSRSQGGDGRSRADAGRPDGGRARARTRRRMRQARTRVLGSITTQYDVLESKVLNSPHYSAALRALRFMASYNPHDVVGSQRLWSVLCRVTQTVMREQYAIAGDEEFLVVDPVLYARYGPDRVLRSSLHAAQAAQEGTQTDPVADALQSSPVLIGLRTQIQKAGTRLKARLKTLQDTQRELENKLAFGNVAETLVPARHVASVETHYQTIIRAAVAKTKARELHIAKLRDILDALGRTQFQHALAADRHHQAKARFKAATGVSAIHPAQVAKRRAAQHRP